MKKAVLMVILLALLLCGCGAKGGEPMNNAESYSLQDGRYLSDGWEGTDDAGYPYLLIFDSRFTIVQHVAVSYQPSGKVRLEGNELVLQGDYAGSEFCYVFSLIGNDMLRFDLAKSLPTLRGIAQWKDGITFVRAKESSSGVYGTTDKSQMTTEQIELMERYPAYFGLDASNGLDVIVWQMAEGSYSFGLLEHSEDQRDLRELMMLGSMDAEQMKAVLRTYPVEEDKIYIIPWQNPLSSYIPGLWIIRDGEDQDANAEAYIESIRNMLFE